MAAFGEDGGDAAIVERVAERGFAFLDLGAQILAELGDDVFLLHIRQPESNGVQVSIQKVHKLSAFGAQLLRFACDNPGERCAEGLIFLQ
jgi:hypothetical protein